MPNGDGQHAYNEGQCQERHANISRQFREVESRFASTDQRLDRIDSRLWGLVILALVQVIGIASLLLSVSL